MGHRASRLVAVAGLLTFVLAAVFVGRSAAADATPFIDSASLLRQLRDGNIAVFVDVRTPTEYEAGHIAGAVSVPLDAIVGGARAFPRDQNVVLYCACPNAQAVMAYRTLMYEPPWPRLYVLRDGYTGWVANRGAMDVGAPARAGR